MLGTDVKTFVKTHRLPLLAKLLYITHCTIKRHKTFSSFICKTLDKAPLLFRVTERSETCHILKG